MNPKGISPELDDVLVLIATFIKMYKAGSPWGMILMAILPQFSKAVDGVELIPAEFLKDPVSFFQTLGTRIGEIYGDLVAGKNITPLTQSRAMR